MEQSMARIRIRVGYTVLTKAEAQGWHYPARLLGESAQQTLMARGHITVDEYGYATLTDAGRAHWAEARTERFSFESDGDERA